MTTSKNELATVAPAATPSKLFGSEFVRSTLALLHDDLETIRGEDRFVTRLPTAVERSRLHERSKDLASLLRPSAMAVAEQDAIGRAVGFLLGWFGVKDDDKHATIAGYVMLLKELPSWAVIEACNDLARGQATEEVNGQTKRISVEFAPKAPRIYALAREKITALLAEQQKIARVMNVKKLAAPVVADSERSRVAIRFRAMADGMNAEAEAERRASRERSKKAADEAYARAEAIRKTADAPVLAEYAAMGLVPVRTRFGRLVSPTLLAPDERVRVKEDSQ